MVHHFTVARRVVFALILTLLSALCIPTGAEAQSRQAKDSFIVGHTDYAVSHPNFVRDIRSTGITAGSFKAIDKLNNPDQFIQFLEIWKKHFPEKSNFYAMYPKSWYAKLSEEQKNRLKSLKVKRVRYNDNVDFLALTEDEQIATDEDDSSYDADKQKEETQSRQNNIKRITPKNFIDANSIYTFLAMKPRFRAQGTAHPTVELSWDDKTNRFLLTINDKHRELLSTPPHKIKGEWFDENIVGFGVWDGYRNVPLYISTNNGNPYFFIEPQETREDTEWMRAAGFTPTGDVWWTNYIINDDGIGFTPYNYNSKPNATKYYFVGFGESSDISIATAQSANDIVEKIDEVETYKGGDVALSKFVSSNLKYPSEAVREKIEGRVLISFIVELNGQISDVKVVRGANPILDKEALRVIKLTSGNWLPAKKNGTSVRHKRVQPINFRL